MTYLYNPSFDVIFNLQEPLPRDAASERALQEERTDKQSCVLLALNPAARVPLYRNSGPHLAHMPNTSPSQRTAHQALQLQSAYLQSHVFLLAQPAAHMCLHHDARAEEALGAQLLEVGDLSGAEEYLGFTKLVLVLIAHYSAEDCFTVGHQIVLLNLRRVDEEAVARDELYVAPARGVPCRGDAHRLDHTARTQLLHYSRRHEPGGMSLLDSDNLAYIRTTYISTFCCCCCCFYCCCCCYCCCYCCCCCLYLPEGCFVIIGFDTPNKVRNSCSQGVHKEVQGCLELGKGYLVY